MLTAENVSDSEAKLIEAYTSILVSNLKKWWDKKTNWNILLGKKSGIPVVKLHMDLSIDLSANNREFYAAKLIGISEELKKLDGQKYVAVYYRPAKEGILPPRHLLEELTENIFGERRWGRVSQEYWVISFYEPTTVFIPIKLKDVSAVEVTSINNYGSGLNFSKRTILDDKSVSEEYRSATSQDLNFFNDLLAAPVKKI